MYLSSLKYAPGSRKTRKRIGRGQASGTGGTAGRGHKGYHSRSGSKSRIYFEGGQMPLQRRLPKRGFKNPFREEYQIVNLSQIDKLQEDAVDPEIMFREGLIDKVSLPVKILGDGELKGAKEITASAFSKSAKQKIESAGGKAIIL